MYSCEAKQEVHEQVQIDQNGFLLLVILNLLSALFVNFLI